MNPAEATGKARQTIWGHSKLLRWRWGGLAVLGFLACPILLLPPGGWLRAAETATEAGAGPAPTGLATPASGGRGGTDHWSLQPVSPRPIPANGRCGNPIDEFLEARLQAAGITPAGGADRGTLVRRLSFDLLGLPPAWQEVESFVNDSSADAYERLVDRLLASPRYGERWGRHWLDVVRFTESQGFEYDKLRENAWPYRDYVIDSLNRDKPYDRFMMEQVAGDVLEPVTSEGIIAAGLLVCGSWDEAGNSQANVTQKAITREEEMEDLISVVGQTFLGLTINCARCHAHKFDPIPQEDYYRIKSVFEGVKHGERTVAGPAAVQAREDRLAHLRQTIAAAEREVAELEAGGRLAAAKAGRPGASPHHALPEPLVRFEFAHRRPDELGELKGGARVEKERLILEKAGAYLQSKPLDREVREKTLEAWVALSDLDQGGGAAISLESDDGQIFDALVYGEREPRKWTAGSNGFERTRDLAAPEESTPAGDWVHLAAVYQADGTIAVFRNGVAYGSPYRPATPLAIYQAGRAHLLLGKRHQGGSRAFLTGHLRAAALYDRALTEAEVQAAFQSSGFHVPIETALANLSQDERAWRVALLERVRTWRAELAAVPVLPAAYAGTRVQPAPTHRLKRGDVKSPEETVAPAGLSAIRAVASELGLAPDAPEAQRRLKFAEWLADRRNPLPARVLVNRVWQYHFGQGLVSTPNDFGAAGAPPSHPELLDWLADWFMDHGWSLKALHRLILSSSAYRRASVFDEKAARADADNQLLWRFAPRRLEAEVVRDAMLAVSGQINLQAGGPSFRPFDALKFPANAYLPVDKLGPEFNRRSVYRMNVNSGKDPLLDAFDCPDPSVKTPRRGVTTTPLQALGLMNNSFVLRQAAALAERAQTSAPRDPAAAVRQAYRWALGRPPTTEETRRALAAAQQRSLTNVCWALLNSTEFVYVR